MNHPILYLGDTSLTTAASYLGGILAHSGREFDYLPSEVPLAGEQIEEPRALYIISDYPAVRIGEEFQQRIVRHVREGSGLLMIGGWESFQGSGGGWNGTPIAEVLPVEIDVRDDRQNCDCPVFVACRGEHPIVDGLPWNQRPPLIGGYNRVRARKEATLLLTAEGHEVLSESSGYRLAHRWSDPLLVVGEAGQGRVAALMTDLAPHWVGPLVDWGDGRVIARAPGADEIEVGDLYAAFVKRLVEFVLG